MGICRIFESSLMIRACDEILTMDLNEIAEFLNSAARSVGASFAFAWLVIRLVTSVIRNPFIVRLVSVAAWLVAALSILGLLEPTIEMLDSVSVVLGGLRLTPLLLIKLGVMLIVALWLTNIASNFVESRITRSTDLTPSIQVLLIKVIRLALMVFAVAVVLSAAGINLSALAIL